jgi:hypothetical protein
VSAAVGLFFVPAAHIEWDEHRRLGGMSMGHSRVTQSWVRDGDQWRITEVDAEGRVREVQQLQVDDDGVRILGIWKGETYLPWAPALMWLPPYPSLGQRFEAEHQRPDGTRSRRSVEIVASTLSEGAISVVTDVQPIDPADPSRQFRLLVRDHFAPGTGWIGYEAMLVRPTGTLRSWSAAVTRDGRRLPDPEAP